MPSTQEFSPNWASAPGDTIADILTEQNISLLDFARSMGQTPKATRNLLEGRATITIATARKLERLLGASVEFWIARDYQYRQNSDRIHASDEKAWLTELPVGDMIRFGWVTPAPQPSDELAACLRFFGVLTVAAWQEKYAAIPQIAAFRTSPSFDSRPAAVAAWMRQGEIESETIACGPWNATRFRESLSTIRSLTRLKDPDVFIPKLRQHCAESGVAVAIVRDPSGCRASGATWFLSSNKALLLLSFRHLTDDHLWFTFFHEAGHLLLHGYERLFLEGIDGASTAEEEEANQFAAETLIPAEYESRLKALPPDSRAVIRFATQVGVSPGIVVGQLQHLRRIRPNQLNSLKRRFCWPD